MEHIPIRDSNAIHAILVDNSNLVCASPTELQVWKAKNLKLPPRILPLQDPKCTNPLPALNYNICTLIDTKTILLGSQEAFQVWEMGFNKCTFLFEGRSEQPIVSIAAFDKTVVTCSGVSLAIWVYNEGLKQTNCKKKKFCFYKLPASFFFFYKRRIQTRNLCEHG